MTWFLGFISYVQQCVQRLVVQGTGQLLAYLAPAGRLVVPAGPPGNGERNKHEQSTCSVFSTHDEYGHCNIFLCQAAKSLCGSAKISRARALARKPRNSIVGTQACCHVCALFLDEFRSHATDSRHHAGQNALRTLTILDVNTSPVACAYVQPAGSGLAAHHGEFVIGQEPPQTNRCWHKRHVEINGSMSMLQAASMASCPFKVDSHATGHARHNSITRARRAQGFLLATSLHTAISAATDLQDTCVDASCD